MIDEGLILPAGFNVRAPDGDQFIVKGLLGQGGFGAVYLVSEKSAPLNLFALKVVTNPDQKERARFLFEGEVLKRLRHPALPRVYQVFENAKLRRVYILMDFIRGQNLENLRQRQPDKCFPLPLALSLLKSTAEALSYIHSQRPPIIHRDIKPSNIIVPLGMERTVLVDFGIAKEYVHNTTTTAMRHGSPGYASPEHYSSGTNVRTDIYGLGATLYTLLTGIIPIDAITRATSYRRDPLRPLNTINPNIPHYVSLAVERAMAISKEERFATIEEFWRHLTSPVARPSLHGFAIPDLKTTLAHTITGEDIEKMATLHLHEKQTQQLRPNKLYKQILFVLLLLFCLTIPIDAILLHTLLTRHTLPSIHPNIVSQLPQTATPIMYPDLNSNYSGTISDPYTPNTGKPLYLKQLQQQAQYIQGHFEGLGIAALFKGSITPQGHITFTVNYPANSETISFDGSIKLGGELVGSYTILNLNQQSTGLSGVWQLEVTSSS
jgi:eukaryotic-like serine/threonine-protein kinase